MLHPSAGCDRPVRRIVPRVAGQSILIIRLALNIPEQYRIAGVVGAGSILEIVENGFAEYRLAVAWIPVEPVKAELRV